MIRRLVCPTCDKLLGKTVNPRVAPGLLLYCKRCKREVTPVVE